MRIFVLSTVTLLSFLTVVGQDGSNMKYLKPTELNDSHIGKLAHLDFGQRSFAVFDYDGKWPLDTVTVELDGTKYTFREHRIDDGFNNWFKDQYLETTELLNGVNLRITKNEILDIKADSILVRAYFDFLDQNGKNILERSFTKELAFRKDEIAEVLIKDR